MRSGRPPRRNTRGSAGRLDGMGEPGGVPAVHPGRLPTRQQRPLRVPAADPHESDSAAEKTGSPIRDRPALAPVRRPRARRVSNHSCLVENGERSRRYYADCSVAVCAVSTATGVRRFPPRVVLMAADAEQIRVLLVEDDDGDAFLVEELLREAGGGVEVQRVRLLPDARRPIRDAACVLLDLGLPDSQGLDGLRGLLREQPDVAVVVLTGLADEYLGEQAVKAGAQDYLVKGDVSGKLLLRVIRYAMERRRWDGAQRQLNVARLSAEENARLERGLLPSPVLDDARLSVSTRYRAGGQQRLLGGDFYDGVQAPGGWVHALIGDVCGRGPAEAALGVCLRVAWRALVLAGQPAGETPFTLTQL